MKVAVLYVGIGKYINFWNGFFLSCEQFFLTKAKKQYFVFTNAEHFPFDTIKNVKSIYQEDEGWPGNTLFRYRFFMRIVDELKEYDYIYFFNGNVLFLTPVSVDEFCPPEDQLLVVGHHYYWDKSCYEYAYDRNEKSLAYIPYGEGKHYVCGGINGAKSKKYIDFIKEMYKRIEEDNANGVVPLWHDESHINRYIIDYPSIMLLPPAYCYPEIVANPNISGIRRIICRDKRKYFDIYNLKNPEQEIEQLKYDSKHFLIEETHRKVLEKWLWLSCRGKGLADFFLRRGIHSIAITVSDLMGELFYEEIITHGEVTVKKLNRYVQDVGGITFENEQCQCLVVTDVYSFAKIYERIRPIFPSTIFSLEDVVNELYEEMRDKIRFPDDGFPLNLLPQKSRIVLIGAGKIGKMYMHALKKTDLKLEKWIDTKHNGVNIFGEHVFPLEPIAEKYDYMVLATSKDDIVRSMTEDLKKANMLDTRVVYFDREISVWRKTSDCMR